ncbi:MAG: helix-turn-helix transcriptional regulator [Candidatus Binatia bacterium]
MIRLTLERNRRQWSKARLAREAKLCESIVSKVERGYARPYPGELARLARALGVPPKDAHTLIENVDDGGAHEPDAA